ncbi:MAG: response regulator [Candidatus Binatia bacterium]
MPDRILIIEDNATNLELMAYLLAAFGYTVAAAHDGLEGVAAVRAAPPALVICDVQLPRMDGFEFARWIKATPPLHDIPLIAVTALAMVGDREKLLAAGFDGYIAKPIDPERFVSAVEAFLRPEQRRERQAVEADDRPNLEARTAAASTGIAILVVDDLQVNRDLARSTFEPLGYTVLTARTVDEALAAARRSRPNVLLCDLFIGDESGADLIDLFKRAPDLQHIPIVVLASGIPQTPQHAAALSSAHFILRPVEPQAVISAIEDALRRGGVS